jgi:hypothetical protein
MLSKTTIGQTRLILEDFSTLRMNHDSPPSPLWQPYVGGTSMGPGQVGSLQSFFYRDQVPANQAPTMQFFPYPYNVPSGYAKNNLRSGTWPTNGSVNRLSFWMRVSGSNPIPLRGPVQQSASVGTYTNGGIGGDPNNQGDHYYHYLHAIWYPNRWMLVTINRTPTHQVGQNASINWQENPTRWTGNPTYKSGGWDYFDGLTRFYFEPEYPDMSAWGNRSYDFADVEFAAVPNEPDQLVAGVTATYTGDHYEIGFNGPKNTAQSYTVYYATSSMHTNGLGAGTKSSTVATGGDTYTGVLWTSPALSQPTGGMYFAIQPSGSSTFTEVYLPTGPNFVGGAGGPVVSNPPSAPTNVRVE